MTESVMEFMGKDHDRLDRIFGEFRKTKNGEMEKARQMFHEFKTGLQRHIVWEEEILFPIFEEKTGMRDTGPTSVMRSEHRKIKGFLEEIHKRVAKGQSDGIAEIEDELLEVLKEHNDKEESVLYPWIDRETSEQERNEAFERIRNLPPEKYNKCCE